MNQPTPTPWEITGEADTDCGWAGFTFYEVHGSDGDLVALVAGEPNARLIVNAAKLRQLIEKIAKWSEDTDHYPTEDLEGMVSRAGNKARALLEEINS